MNLIFDLDGTLVDSAPGVLASLEHALKECNVPIPTSLSSDLIGPPLREILSKLLGTEADSKVLESVETQFKNHYDTKGVLKTKRFNGVEAMLDTLIEKKYDLYIATNKRNKPTRILYEHYSWNKYFSRIYSLDSVFPHAKNKASLLKKIIEIHSLNKSETIYIGDRLDDAKAAKNCGIKFLYARWGDYEDNAITKSFEVLDLPGDIKKYV